MIDGLHGGPRDTPGFRSFSDKTSAGLWVQLCVSPSPGMSCFPLTMSRASWSITQPIVPAPSALAPLALAAAPFQTGMNRQKTVPFNVQDVDRTSNHFTGWDGPSRSLGGREKREKNDVFHKFPRIGVNVHMGIYTFLNIVPVHVRIPIHVHTCMNAHTDTRPGRQNNKCAALLCAGFDNAGE